MISLILGKNVSVLEFPHRAAFLSCFTASAYFCNHRSVDNGDLVSVDSPEYFSKAVQSDWTDLRLQFSLCIPKSILNLPIFLGHGSGNGKVPFSLTWWGWWSLLSLLSVTFPLAAQRDSSHRQMPWEEKHLPQPLSLSCAPLSLDPFILSSPVSHPKRTELANSLREKRHQMSGLPQGVSSSLRDLGPSSPGFHGSTLMPSPLFESSFCVVFFCVFVSGRFGLLQNNLMHLTLMKVKSVVSP